jgi:hypothetical protein
MGKGRKKKNWAMEPFQKFLDSIQHIQDLLVISKRGISLLERMPKLVEVLANQDIQSQGRRKKITKANIRRAKREAKLARKETATEFSQLHAQVIVAMWTFLEATITEFMEVWIKNEPGAIQIDPIQDLKVRLGEYERHEGDSRYSFIVDQLEVKFARENVRYGYERFEKMMGLFDLSSDIPPKLHKTLVEFSQVRNCIVHRAGVVDMQLLKTCPWLPYKPGDRVATTSDMVVNYSNATAAYVTLIICRVGKKHGKNMGSSVEGVLNEWTSSTNQ